MDVTTTINGGSITGCNSGIGMQSGDIIVTVNDVTFGGNTTDITLREDQQITIAGAVF